MLDNKQCMDFANKQIAGRYKIPIIAIIIANVISLIFDFISTRFNPIQGVQKLSEYLTLRTTSFADPRDTALVLIIGIVSTLIAFVLDYAFTILLLKMAKNPDPVKFSDYTDGFTKFSRGLLTYLWITLIYFIWAIPLGLGIGLLTVIFAMITGTGSSLIVPFIVIFMFVGIILYLIKILDFIFSPMISAEFEGISIPRCTDISKQLTRGAKKQIVWIWIKNFAPLVAVMILLGIIFKDYKSSDANDLFGTGFKITILIETIISTAYSCWRLPLYNLALINLYHSQLKDCVERGELHAEEFGIEMQAAPAEETEQKAEITPTIEDNKDEKTE